MSQGFRIDTQGHVVRVIFERQTVVTPEMVIQAMESENEQHAIEGRYDLWDFQGCRTSEDFGYDAITRIIDHIENNYNDVWSVKTALLVEETIQFGLSRMFQIMIDEFPTNIGIFKDEAAAMAWLAPLPEPREDTP